MLEGTESQLVFTELQSEEMVGVMWHDTVTLWHCNIVTLWHCDTVHLVQLILKTILSSDLTKDPDTAGENECIVVVFSLTDSSSLEDTKIILDKLWQSGVTGNLPLILVGNKTDLVRTRQVTIEGEKDMIVDSWGFEEISPQKHGVCPSDTESSISRWAESWTTMSTLSSLVSSSRSDSGNCLSLLLLGGLGRGEATPVIIPVGFSTERNTEREEDYLKGRVLVRQLFLHY